MSKSGLLDDLHLPKSRRLILVALKEHGGLTADQLAEMLRISAVAVRRHLDSLEHADLIEHEEVQRGMGRPSFVYTLTNKADHVFPRNYEELASDILDTVQELYGQDAVDAIFQQRMKKITDLYRPRINANTLEGRLKQLADLRSKDGYMATWLTTEDGKYIFTERNCPIEHVAETCSMACHSDLSIFIDLLDAEVIRLNHRMQGDHYCSYEVRPRTHTVEA